MTDRNHGVSREIVLWLTLQDAAVCVGSRPRPLLLRPIMPAEGYLADRALRGADAALLIAREEGLRDRDRLPAFLALVLGLAFLALVSLMLVRVVVAFLAERRRTGFSGVVSGDVFGVAAAAVAARCDGPRPSPMVLANCDRCSE
jgi:hypothetical protein